MYVAAQAAVLMREMLARGFTSVRDNAGADHGLAQAQADGLLPGRGCSSAAGRCRRPVATATRAAAVSTPSMRIRAAR